MAGNNHVVLEIEGMAELSPCGICLEQIEDKPLPEQVYGVLHPCNHKFCWSCIIQWSQTAKVSSDTCPNCRKRFACIVPSNWTNHDEKGNELFERFKKDLQSLCKFTKYDSERNAICSLAPDCSFGHKTVCKDSNGQIVLVRSKQLTTLSWSYRFSLVDYLGIGITHGCPVVMSRPETAPV